MKKIFFYLLITLTLIFSVNINAEELEQGQASTSEVIKSGNRDFITITTEDNKTYYLIIDYDSNTNNVYFLKQVEESDLSSLVKLNNLFSEDTNIIVDESTTSALEEVENNISSTTANETEVTEIPTKRKIDIIPLIAIVLLIVLIVYVVYSKVKSKKTKDNNSYFDEEDYTEYKEDKEVYEEDNETLIERLKNKKDRKDDIF